MGCDNMHRITSKRQHLTQQNLQFSGTLNVGYDLSYTYGTDAGKKFQLQTVGDVNYRTEETPGEDANVKNSHAYEYDANGNLIYVNTSREKKDGESDEKAGERKLRWDEENRLLASDDNGFVTNYRYDADGQAVQDRCVVLQEAGDERLTICLGVVGQAHIEIVVATVDIEIEVLVLVVFHLLIRAKPPQNGIPAPTSSP